MATDFDTNVFVNYTSFNQNFSTLVAYTFMYFFFGYISVLLGYYLVRKKNLPIRFIFEKRDAISDTVLNIFIIVFLTIGISYFVFNIFMFADGNIYKYMSNIAIRNLEDANLLNTIGAFAYIFTYGYILAYNAMYIWFFKLARTNIYWNKSFLLFLFITVIMKASTGRIFGTLAYILTFVGIYYFLEISNNKIINNIKYYFIAFGLVAIGIIFYFLRIISYRANYSGLNTSITNIFFELFSEIGFWAVDKGNIPNVGVVLKIIDSWETDIGYLYGKSLITWICNIWPSSLRPEAYQPSVMIKQTWYLHAPGGNLPPTAIGEMYANFGIFGPFLGMFLFGCVVALLYNYMIRSKNYWILVIYIQITCCFVMLYPKGEFDNLTLWLVLPILFILITSKIISSIKSHKDNTS